MDRTPFHPFCSQGQNEQNVANENPRWRTARWALRIQIRGLPRCKNLTRFSLFVSFCFAVRYCLKCFCFLCFTSSVSFTGSYTEVKPKYVSTGEKIRLHFWTQWNIASNFIVPQVRGFFQWCFVQEKGRTRTAHLDGRFLMQTIRIIPSIPYQPFLFQNCG